MERKAFYFSIVLVILLAILAFIVVRPYATALVFAMVLAYISHPLYKKVASKISPNGAATLFSVCVVAILIFIIQYGIITLIYEFAKIPAFFQQIDLSAITSEDLTHMGFTFEGLVRKGLSVVTAGLYDVVYKIPQTLVSLLVFFFAYFFFLKDGEVMFKWVKDAVPLPHHKRNVMFVDIQRYAAAFIKVQVMIALIQGVVAGVGFTLFSIPYAAPAAIVAAILSILPVIGPYALYIPVGVAVILTGNVAGGLGILIYGLAIGSILDYIVRPNLMSRYANLHPLVVLIGILGGIASMGVVGIIIGPVVLSIFLIVLNQLKEEGYFASAEK